MSLGLIVLVYALAVARVTRLINSDRLTERPRLALEARLWRRNEEREAARWGITVAEITADRALRDPPLSVYLLTCPWCVSIYVAAVAAPVAYFWGQLPWLFVPALALAFSHVTGLMAKIGE
jgi:hypothetical protein